MMKKPTTQTMVVENEESTPEPSSASASFTLTQDNWMDHPSLPETFELPSILVPSAQVHSLIKQQPPQQKKEGGAGEQRNHGHALTPYLASNMDILSSVHPRIKIVQTVDGERDRKAILLDPNQVLSSSTTPTQEQTDNDGGGEQMIQECEDDKSISSCFPGMSSSMISFLESISATVGPSIRVQLSYEQQSVQRILTKILPPSSMPPPTGYEQIGHVVHLNLKERHYEYRKIIGAIILDRLPNIETVVNKVGEVGGQYRTYDMEVLAGKKSTEVNLMEDGINLRFDLKKVYWCSRLSGERSRLIRDSFKEGDAVADVFCGVGALCVLAASKRGCSIYANDLNPDAAKYCIENGKRNFKKDEDASSERIFDVNCGDAFDFIQNLSAMKTLPNHVVMNYPLDSASFLGALRWWPSSGPDMKRPPEVHLYTFARGDDKKDLGESARDAIEVAIDLVADGLLPEGGAIESTRNRRAFLNNLGCSVNAREVRDVAPGKVVIYVNFKVTKSLLSTMHGDFIDF